MNFKLLAITAVIANGLIMNLLIIIISRFEPINLNKSKLVLNSSTNKVFSVYRHRNKVP